MAQRTLSEFDRRLFDLATRAAVVNPFGTERQQIERELAADRVGGTPRHSVFEAALDAVDRRLTKVGQGATPASGVDAGDVERLRLAHLFVAHHRACDVLDQHVAQQLSSPSPDPVPFPAASEILDDLEQRGFDPEERPLLLSLFFQLRRAYYFIDRALVGSSPSMRALRERLWNNVFTRDLTTYVRDLRLRMEDFSTLVLGETGTGKGNAAAAIGRSGAIPYDARSQRFAESFTRAFVPVNLAEFSSSLLESELFGHRKGAFTGATEHREGVFARCSPHGSILLDELGELDQALQVKLLRVLQDRSFTPVGGRDPRRFEGRLIAATNRAREELVGERGLRPDLYYRLCSDEVVVPPLRERLQEDPGELPLLVAHLLERLVGEPRPALTERITAKLRADVSIDYAWPGNVRELEQAVRRVLIDGTYGPSPQPSAPPPAPPFIADLMAGQLDARSLLAHYCEHLYTRLGSYEAVAARTGLDRRTVKKHVQAHRAGASSSD